MEIFGEDLGGRKKKNLKEANRSSDLCPDVCWGDRAEDKSLGAY